MKTLIFLLPTLLLAFANPTFAAKKSCSSVIKSDELSDKAVKLAVSALVDESLDQGKIIGPRAWLMAMKSSKDAKLKEELSALSGNFSRSADLLSALKMTDLEALFEASVNKSKVQKFKKALAPQLGSAGIDFLVKNLKTPSINDIAEGAKVDPKFLGLLFTNEELKDVWDAAVVQESQKLDDIRNTLQSAANRYFAQRSTPKAERKTLPEPTIDDLLDNLTLTQANKRIKALVESGALQKKHIERLFGLREEKAHKSFLTPAVYDGVDGLLKDAFENNPNSLTSFWPARFGQEYANETLEMLKNGHRFLVTSITAGISLEENQLRSMLSYAEARDATILVGVANRNFMAIPEVLLNHPRIRIVTHSFDLGEELRIYDIPIYAKNANAHAGLKSRSIGQRGQTQIVFHPQLKLDAVATVDNAENRHELWSTGSLNVNRYPAKGFQSQRVSYLAKERHFNGFLVLEKSDAKSGHTGIGSPGQWHIRPVSFVNDSEHTYEDGTKGLVGFTDNGKHYAPDGTITDMEVTVSGEGDNHDRYQNGNMLAAILKDMPTPTQTITLDDILDGDSHNHHERKSPTAQSSKYQAGRLSILTEINQMAATLNQRLLRTPDSTVIRIKDANHGDWLSRYIETMPIDPVNQVLIDRLRYAVTTLGMHPLEYMVTRFASDIAQEEPHIRRALSGKVVNLIAPDRVVFLKHGSRFVTGPYWRQNHNGLHGHQGANGARGSDNANAAAIDGGSIGHTHRGVIFPGFANNGQLVINHGASLDLDVPYARGGFSSWSYGYKQEYKDGTAQLFPFKAAIGSFYAKDENGYLPPETFFTTTPRVIENDNEVMAPAETFVEDQYSNYVK